MESLATQEANRRSPDPQPSDDPRGAQDLDSFGAEHFVEDGTEPLVPIVHQVLDLCGSALSCFAQFRAIWAHQAALAAPSVTPPMR